MAFKKFPKGAMQVVSGDTKPIPIQLEDGKVLEVVRLILFCRPMSGTGATTELRPLFLHSQAARRMAAQLLEEADKIDAPRPPEGTTVQ